VAKHNFDCPSIGKLARARLNATEAREEQYMELEK
jgi:hypothetical protein